MAVERVTDGGSQEIKQSGRGIKRKIGAQKNRQPVKRSARLNKQHSPPPEDSERDESTEVSQQSSSEGSEGDGTENELDETQNKGDGANGVTENKSSSEDSEEDQTPGVANKDSSSEGSSEGSEEDAASHEEQSKDMNSPKLLTQVDESRKMAVKRVANGGTQEIKQSGRDTKRKIGAQQNQQAVERSSRLKKQPSPTEDSEGDESTKVSQQSSSSEGSEGDKTKNEVDETQNKGDVANGVAGNNSSSEDSEEDQTPGIAKEESSSEGSSEGSEEDETRDEEQSKDMHSSKLLTQVDESRTPVMEVNPVQGRIDKVDPSKENSTDKNINSKDQLVSASKASDAKEHDVTLRPCGSSVPKAQSKRFERLWTQEDEKIFGKAWDGYKLVHGREPTGEDLLDLINGKISFAASVRQVQNKMRMWKCNRNKKKTRQKNAVNKRSKRGLFFSSDSTSDENNSSSGDIQSSKGKKPLKDNKIAGSVMTLFQLSGEDELNASMTKVSQLLASGLSSKWKDLIKVQASLYLEGLERRKAKVELLLKAIDMSNVEHDDNIVESTTI